MGIFDILRKRSTGPTAPPRETAAKRDRPSSPQASALAAEALELIERQVQIGRGLFEIRGVGSEGELMKAVHKLEEAHRLEPEVPLLHYAWASALQLAMQNKSAREQMEELARKSPDFLLAKLAVESWDAWRSHFLLPPWSPGTRTIHPVLSSVVKTSTLLAVRDGLRPRATLFLRDGGGDLQNPQSLGSVRVDLAIVISPFTDPQVVGLYMRIWDNPRDPLKTEALGIPLYPRGHEMRLAHELLCTQGDLDFVILDRNDNVLLDRRIPMTPRMIQARERLRKLLESSAGRQIPVPEMLRAMEVHRSRLSLDDVQY